ncbi:MAG TPA: protein kinase, partial [Thermoanaerobaculia bacterium]
MSPAERLRVDHLVLTAAALDGDARSAFLAALPDADRALADEVRRRLAAAGALPESFLAPPPTAFLAAAAAADAADDAEEPAPPAGGDRYAVGEPVGAGGMGRVYRAFDRRLGRPVALKVLRAGDAETPRRLIREARAQARVRHEHVLEVYDTGELDGRPFISMRLIEGRTLGELGEEVTLEQRVRLVAQVAEGLHAAHREGLLHGDVKPSNVLVEETPDGELRAWIGDFGIAREVGGPEAGGGLAGTPQFMAPELVAGERAAADRRADVFSLGVTLHQALTGELPPPADGSDDPRRWPARLPPDLGAVVARCLAPDPADRYPSARAVADDLRRFLDGEVVTAYADRLAYRLTRFTLRHRTLLAVAGVSALLLAAALVAAALAGMRAVRANALADQRRGQAEELIGFMLLDLRDRLEPVGRLDVLDEVGRRAMRYFAAVPAAELSDEELARRSVALYQIGDVRIRQGDLAGAERPLAESLALARQLAARDPGDPERLFGLGQSEFWAGYAHWKRGDLDAARRHFEAYREAAERLVALDPRNADWQLELSYAHSNLGSLLQKQGDLEGALERFRAALAIDRRLVAAAADAASADERRFEMAATHNTIGVVLEQTGRLAEAEEHLAADLAIRRELAAADPRHQRWREFLGTSRQYLGRLLATRGDHAGARPHLEAARDLFDELAARDADNGVWRYKRAWSHLWLGRLEHAEGRAGEAAAAWTRAAAIAEELAAADPASVDRRQLLGVARLHRAMAAAAADDAAAARSRAAAALEVLAPLAAAHPDDRRAHRWLAETLLVLGDAEAAGGRAAAAESAWARAAEALAPWTAAGTRDPALLVPWAGALDRLGRGADAAGARATLAEIGAAAPPP